MDRRVVRAKVSKAFLSELLKARSVEPGDRITSNLPADAELIGVTDDGYAAATITVTLRSDLFTPVLEGDEVPLLAITFTRHRAAEVRS